MKKLTLLEDSSKELIEIVARKLGLDHLDTNHPQEDFLKTSPQYPIFAVADGVTLLQFPVEKKKYPNPSPAGDVSRIFCEKAVELGETLYPSISERGILEIFRGANQAVGEYNKAHGRTKGSIDYWDVDFYAATAAVAVVKDNLVYWGSICDSYVVCFGVDGSIRFQSPHCDSKSKGNPSEFKWEDSSLKERTQHKWRTRRNALDGNGETLGYGVITGEPEALAYLNVGVFPIQKGDVLAILTDGFEEYIRLPEFVSIITAWPPTLESEIKELTAKKEKEDPDKFGHERSLVLASL